MKKYFTILLLAMISVVVTSCVDRVDETKTVDHDTYSVVYDLSNKNFSYSPSLGYTISKTFVNPLYNSDVVLIYRQNGTLTNGAAIWQQIPRTLYLPEGELDYDFDFSKNDILIKAGGNYNLSTTPNYINNQTFRVVIVPASFGKNANIDYSDYQAVIQYFKINDSKVKSL